MLQITFPQWDLDLFVYLNSKHISWLDPVMRIISSYSFWIAVCAIIIVYLVYKYKADGIAASFFLLVGVGLNSLVNNIIKIIVLRPRPGNNPDIRDIIHQLEDPGVSFSFFSAHSSNSVCLALFTSLYFRNPYYTLAAFAWALIVAYSRIYVGKHFPLDVLCGILFGLLTGWFSFWMYQYYCKKKQ